MESWLEQVAGLQQNVDELGGALRELKSALDEVKGRQRATKRQLCRWQGAVGALLVLGLVLLPPSGMADSKEFDTLRALLTYLRVDVDRKEIILEGANLSLRSGSGHTDANPTNGLGNLIIGYNEPRSKEDDPLARLGSHNLVMGMGNYYPSYGGLVVGVNNTVSGRFSAVSGGTLNTANGNFSSVSGGGSNTASGVGASVTGGGGGTAGGEGATVSGGESNNAGGPGSSVSGGINNTASAHGAAVSGGINNMASAEVASVTAGNTNKASAPASTVSGGRNNTASGNDSAVSGGHQNTAAGQSSAICGGGENSASALGTAILGGHKKSIPASTTYPPGPPWYGVSIPNNYFTVPSIP